jgi:hypothetical protein
MGMPRGYAEGPVAEEAERRLDELDRRPRAEDAPERPAVFGSTEEDAEPHFLGWVGEVDPDELFAAGTAWGLTVRHIRR